MSDELKVEPDPFKKPKNKPKRVLTPEQKAVLVERLKKGRAKSIETRQQKSEAKKELKKICANKSGASELEEYLEFKKQRKRESKKAPVEEDETTGEMKKMSVSVLPEPVKKPMEVVAKVIKSKMQSEPKPEPKPEPKTIKPKREQKQPEPEYLQPAQDDAAKREAERVAKIMAKLAMYK